jgi:hypothetical protein
MVMAGCGTSSQPKTRTEPTQRGVHASSVTNGQLGAASGKRPRVARTEPQPSTPLVASASFEVADAAAPGAVRARAERHERAALEQARQAAQLPATIAAGCAHVERTDGTDTPGPPAPDVRSRIIGHQVETVFRYRHLPRSPACRPAFVNVVVYSGRKGSAGFRSLGSAQKYAVSSARGRVITDLPWGGRPPYRISISSLSVVARRGVEIDRPLSCPGGGQAVGCLRGYRPGRRSMPIPRPILSLRDLTRAQLELSLRTVIAADVTPPRPTSASCSSTRLCVVTFVDPAFPQRPYRTRYRIAGEQAAGCWMAWRQRVLDPPPYPQADPGPLELVGCKSWRP